MPTIDSVGKEIRPSDICLVFCSGGKSDLIVAEIIKPKTINGTKSSSLIVITEEQARNHRIENYKGFWAWGEKDENGRTPKIQIHPQERKIEKLEKIFKLSRELKTLYNIED